MPDIRPGPYRAEDSTVAIKLEGPTLRILAGDGSLVLAASIKGSVPQSDQVKAAVAVVVDALNGGASDGNDAYREALARIASSEVTNAAAAKEIARGVLG